MDLIKEYFEDDSRQVLNEFTTSTIRNILKETPIVSKKIFYDSCKPCDILLCYTQEHKLLTSMYAQIKAAGMSTFQGMPYTTSKLVIDKNTVMGYGMEMDGKNKLYKADLKKILSNTKAACLIRIPDLTNDQKKKIVLYFLKRKGLEYSSIDIFKSTWDRFVKRKIFPFYKDKPVRKDTVSKLLNPLFCSTIISIAYLSAGVKIKFAPNPYDVWPRDFLISNQTKKLHRF